MHGKHHRGVAYTIVKIDATHWYWNINPPLSVHGLKYMSGTTIGSIGEAVDVVRARIDAQINYRFTEMLARHPVIKGSKPQREHSGR